MQDFRRGRTARHIARDTRRYCRNENHEVLLQRELLHQEDMAQLQWEPERLRVDATKDAT